MDRVSVTTTQNVSIDFDAAGIGDRSIAFIIDFCVLFAYLITAFAIAGDAMSPAVATVLTAPYFLYFLVSEIFFNGQTIGKRARNIKVARIDGTEPGLGDFVIRWLFRLVEIDICMGLIALVTLFFRGNGQRLGDMAAGTTVVKISKNVGLKDTFYAEVESGYRPVFPEAAKLSEKDITLAKEVIDVLRSEHPTNHLSKVGLKMKATLESKMKVASDLPPIDFLSAVLKDFNHLNR